MHQAPDFSQFSREPLKECDSVAAAAIEHLGKAYRITRELRPDFIDCSTVVSQSHWIGAAIQTPFIAESQRIASNALPVEPDEMIAGDAVYAYQTKAASPKGRHNHVVLYLGCDDEAAPWFIESSEETGAVLIRRESVAFGGGIRRFCLNPSREFQAGLWSELVRRVPKLGRLGSRLTADYMSIIRHQGVDVYVDDGWLAVSPLTGVIVDVQGPRERRFAGIWSPAMRLYSVVGPISATPEISVGKELGQGEILGLVSTGGHPGRCNIIPGLITRKHVHWELWGSPEWGPTPLPNPTGARVPEAIRTRDPLIPHNAVYFFKCGHIGTAVSREALCRNSVGHL